MDIRDLEKRDIKQLYDAQLINSIADIYTLEKSSLLTLERMGEKSVSNLLEAIESSKINSLEKLIFVLVILHIVTKYSLIIASNLVSITILIASNPDVSLLCI